MGLLEEVTMQQLWDLEHDDMMGKGLRDPMPASRSVTELVREHLVRPNSVIESSVICDVKGRAISKLDVVTMIDGSVGQVWFHCAIDGVAWSCVCMWEVSLRTKGVILAKVRESPQMVMASMLACSCIHSYSGDCVALILTE